MENLPKDLQAARYLCSHQWPYLSAALWALQPVETKGLKTLGVDKWWRLYYDPDLTWDVPGLATVLYHEVNHLLRDHPSRADLIPDLDAQAWNICGDAEINDDLATESKCKWPQPPVLPSALGQPNGLLAEEYYARLPKITIKITDCGSCAGGAKRDHEKDGPSTAGGKESVPGLSPGEAELIRHHVAKEIQSASQGTVPDHLKRWADTLLNPKLDWRKLLAAQVRHSLDDIRGRADYTYKRAHRRQAIFPQYILPSLSQPVPRCAIVLDVSGSMGTDTLTTALTEANGVFKTCGLRDGVPVYVTDAAVHSARKVYSAKQIELTSGGGTDMRVGIDAAMRGRPKPHLIIVFTDGYTPWPDTAPNARVIVCLVGTKLDAKAGPNYAKVVRVDDV